MPVTIDSKQKNLTEACKNNHFNTTFCQTIIDQFFNDESSGNSENKKWYLNKLKIDLKIKKLKNKLFTFKVSFFLNLICFFRI